MKKEALVGDFRPTEFVFIDSEKEEWTYDEYGNLVEHVVYETKAKPHRIVRYQYKYDQYNNWVKRVRYEGDSDDSMIPAKITERKIEYYE